MVLLSSDRDYYSHVQAQIKIGLAQGREEGRQAGLEEGLRKGREEEKLQTAKNMLFDGLPIGTISRYTGLTEEQVQSLKD